MDTWKRVCQLTSRDLLGNRWFSNDSRLVGPGLAGAHVWREQEKRHPRYQGTGKHMLAWKQVYRETGGAVGGVVSVEGTHSPWPSCSGGHSVRPGPGFRMTRFTLFEP